MRPWNAAVAAVALLGVVLAIVGDDMLDAFGQPSGASTSSRPGTSSEAAGTNP
jgi:putative effector of murein hydrolase